MTDQDLTPEAVERLAARMDVYRIEINGTEHNPGATLRALSDALEAERERADETGITAVEFSEMAAELVEEMSKHPNTSWGQVKAAIRALGDIGDRQAYNRLQARAEAAEAKLKEAARHVQSLVSLIDDLSSDSDGVVGLHMNGDIAPWSDLMEGGNFSQWTEGLPQARAFLASMGDKP